MKKLGADPPAKNPHAVALGKAGGTARAAVLSSDERKRISRSGGKARANSLTGKQKSDIAKKAAAARWGKKAVE